MEKIYHLIDEENQCPQLKCGEECITLENFDDLDDYIFQNKIKCDNYPYVCFRCGKEVSHYELEDVDEIYDSNLSDDQSNAFGDEFSHCIGEKNEFHNNGSVNCCMKCIKDITGFDGKMTNHNDNIHDLVMCEHCYMVQIKPIDDLCGFCGEIIHSTYDFHAHRQIDDFKIAELIDAQNINYIAQETMGSNDDTNVDWEDEEVQTHCESLSRKLETHYENKGLTYYPELIKSFRELFNNAIPSNFHGYLGKLVMIDPEKEIYEIVKIRLDISEKRVKLVEDPMTGVPLTSKCIGTYRINGKFVKRLELLKYQRGYNDWDYCIEKFVQKDPNKYLIRQKLKSGFQIIM